MPQDSAPQPDGELFTVEIRRSITVSVEVRAADGEAAAEQVNKHGFELPPRDEWEGQKDWQYTVTDATGEVVYEQER